MKAEYRSETMDSSGFVVLADFREKGSYSAA